MDRIYGNWKKKVTVFLMLFVLAAVHIVPSGRVDAATAPTVTVKKKTLYVGGDSYKIKFKDLAKSSKVTYKSSDTKIAKVTTTGTIKPVAKGSATVTVSIKQSSKTYTYKIAVTVSNPYVKITSKPETMTVGETFQMVGKTYGLKDVSETWTVSDKTVATINEKTKILTAKKEGTVKVTFKDATSGKTSTATINVVAPPQEEKEEEELPEDELFGYDVEDGGVIITEVYDSTVTSLIIPNSFANYKVTAIGDGAFEGLYDLKTVKIPSTVTSIGDYAFGSCSSLMQIELPSGLKYLGEGAFEYCESLTQVSLPKGIEELLSGTFSGCSALKTVELGSVKAIGDEAFYECVSLTSVSIPSTVKTIGASAFEYCEKLATLTLKSGLEYLDDYAFSGCLKLTTVSLPTSLEYLGSGAFDSCELLKSATIPSSVEDIGSGVFDNCNESLKLRVKRNSAGHEFAEDEEIPYSVY